MMERGEENPTRNNRNGVNRHFEPGIDPAEREDAA